MWYNGTQLLSQQEHKISTDKRFSILSKTSVEIKSVTTDDSNVYLCKVIAAQSLTVKITLEVERNRNMTVRILQNGRDVSLQTVVYEPTARHLPLVLECAVEDDNPKASVAWTNTEGQLLKHNPKHDIYIKEGMLKFGKPQKHHSGNYQCFADNKVDLPVVSSVMLHIKRKSHGS
jgi:Immunoglobulin domain